MEEENEGGGRLVGFARNAAKPPLPPPSPPLAVPSGVTVTDAPGEREREDGKMSTVLGSTIHRYSTTY